MPETSSGSRAAADHATGVAPASPFQPTLPGAVAQSLTWGRLYGDSLGLVIGTAAARHTAPVLVVTPDARSATRLERALGFYASEDVEVLPFPDWETLPYDLFSPHQDIVSRRLETLYNLPGLRRGILVVPAPTLLQRLTPREFLTANCLLLGTGEQLDLNAMSARLEQAGYRRVSQVAEHGEYAVRGALLDLFPMGSEEPYRIDLLDQEVESIRTFDPDSQRTTGNVERVRLLPAREFPMTEEAIARFRQAWRQRFEGDPQRSPVYRAVSEGHTPGGVEYYLPLFHDHTTTLFDHLPDDTLLVTLPDAVESMAAFSTEVAERYEQRRHDRERPLLEPGELFIDPETAEQSLRGFRHIQIQTFEAGDRPAEGEPSRAAVNFDTASPPPVRLQPRTPDPGAAFRQFLQQFQGRVLLAAESTGRREAVLDTLHGMELRPAVFDSWQAFLRAEAALGITVAPLEQGLVLPGAGLAIITEAQLFGERVLQQRRRRREQGEAENIIRNLTDLTIGAPVVHEEHGVGRYQGLQHLEVGGLEQEFLTLEYADGDRLYVPVASLHLISRYSGAAPESAPLHRLGGDQWQKIRRKAAEQVRDVAAELLDLYSRRAARAGHRYRFDRAEYEAFAAGFPFEETPDQQTAIDAVLQDMASEQPMDRVVCGDVGFGKTEVALRAAFVAAQAGRQVAVLVPTTLLAQQHYQNFSDRFADWPIQVEVLSRFQTRKQLNRILEQIAEGKIDIVIGTHRLLQPDVKFQELGLAIIDEEHRFGVRHKERLKALRTEVDVLTMTATPIPRTLNMSLSKLRDLSVIATPPAERVAIKTFVSEWNDALVHEACLREIKRGGQVYMLHNDVKTIERHAKRVSELVPEAEIRIAHGQMRERDLEQVMLDFYHQRFNVLVCTTIIESGIDVPSANTIVINRADHFGLAQLHQLRGRVGRSHHRAYAYLMVPPRQSMTADAIKRLEAIESLEDLGAGFMLATHDLEIRGAGELLGEDQSGQIAAVGYTLYTELLERAVEALKAGRQPESEPALAHGPEVELALPALLPEDYLPDVHSRLVLYKRIASAPDAEALRNLQVEMIDRFGLLPPQTKYLFRITEIKLRAKTLGISRIEAGAHGGRLVFGHDPQIDPVKLVQLVQNDPQRYSLDGQEKLRFKGELEDYETRLQTVETLLDALQPDTENAPAIH